MAPRTRTSPYRNLRRIAGAKDAALTWVVVDSLADLYQTTPDHGRLVLDELASWTAKEPRGNRHRVGLLAFLQIAFMLWGPAPPNAEAADGERWPLLLVDTHDDSRRQRRLLQLWRRALNYAGTARWTMAALGPWVWAADTADGLHERVEWTVLELAEEGARRRASGAPAGAGGVPARLGRRPAVAVDCGCSHARRVAGGEPVTEIGGGERVFRDPVLGGPHEVVGMTRRRAHAHGTVAVVLRTGSGRLVTEWPDRLWTRGEDRSAGVRAWYEVDVGRHLLGFSCAHWRRKGPTASRSRSSWRGGCMRHRRWWGGG